MCHRFLLFFYTLLLGNVLLAAGFVPVVSNYSPFDYGAGLQNWDISQDTEGLMFFGNNMESYAHAVGPESALMYGPRTAYLRGQLSGIRLL